jgi:hypothetical protein
MCLPVLHHLYAVGLLHSLFCLLLVLLDKGIPWVIIHLGVILDVAGPLSKPAGSEIW